MFCKSLEACTCFVVGYNQEIKMYLLVEAFFLVQILFSTKLVFRISTFSVLVFSL